MKRLLQTIVLGMMLAAFALPVLAQQPAASPAATPAQEDVQAAKSADYAKFKAAYDRRKKITDDDPKLQKPGNKEAYDAAYKEANQYATEYLQKYPDDKGQIPDYLKNFVAGYVKYTKADRKNQLNQLLAAKKYDEGFALGKQILADEPDDLFTLYHLAESGLFAAAEGKENFNADTATYAKKSIQLIESGKTFTPGQALSQKDKDETLSRMNYALGVATIKNTPADAIGAFIKVASIEGDAKKDAQTYFLLAAAYEGAEYDKLAADYQAQCKTEEQLNSPSCKAMKERLELVVDRMIDAYARAVSLAGTNPKFAAAKPKWMQSLTDYYKYRHEGKTDGLPEYIASVTNQPLPGPLPAPGATPAPTSSTPMPAPTATPTPGGTSSATPTTPAATPVSNSMTTPKATPVSTTPTPTTQPKATTAPKPTTAPKTTPKKKAHVGRH